MAARSFESQWEHRLRAMSDGDLKKLLVTAVAFIALAFVLGHTDQRECLNNCITDLLSSKR